MLTLPRYRHTRWLATAATLLLAAAATADDRLLLRESAGDPYVFILLDTSGSMNWSTPCTAADRAKVPPNCTHVCDTGDCFVPANGDDPTSKFYQAREALYAVLQDVDNVHFGFGTYNQDGLYLGSKHWLYKASIDGPVIPSYGAFPRTGDTDVFGRHWACDSGNNDNNIGCYPNVDWPADLNDSWERARVSRLPKGDINFGTDQHFFVRNGTNVYYVNYHPQGGNLGDNNITIRIRIDKCNNVTGLTTCDTAASRTLVAQKDTTFTIVDGSGNRIAGLGDFVSWDNGADRTAPANGYWPQNSGSSPYGAETVASNTCSGWDPNTDTSADTFSGYSVKQPTVAGPAPYAPYLDTGDVIPLSWSSTNRDAILRRLAPNIISGETTPDFRTARYFNDKPNTGESFLRFKSSSVRSLVPTGSTPLGASLLNFQTWFRGWRNFAVANDSNWACRRKYLIILTDGDETCGGSPCAVTSSLKTQDGLLTYVVAFGVANASGNQLNCMPTASVDTDGDGREEVAPFYPQNKAQLVAALRSIFDDLKEESRAFASAAVPSVQAQVADKIFLSSFTPLNGASVWDGHLNAFLKPLPIRDGRPDTSKSCSSLPSDRQAGCHVWDAGEKMLSQAPTPDEYDGGNDRLGIAEDQRRVYYPHAKSLVTEGTPNDRSLFTHPGGATDRQDLWDGLGLNYSLADLTASGSTPETNAKKVLRHALIQKTGTVNNPDGTSEEVTYILGDIFHSNPLVIDKPSDVAAFAGNLPEGNPTGVDVDCTTNRGYRCFANKHAYRRKILTVGANDGEMHFFDAGVYDSTDNEFTNGTGKELFAVAPRLSLPIMRELAVNNNQIFAVDGTPRVLDVYIDPVHSTSSPPNPNQREWRTVLIAGMREGGLRNSGGGVSRVTLQNGKPFTSGYVAVDVTQPDKLNSQNKPINTNVVPSCLADYDATACGPVPFGAELWEFTDSWNGSPAEWGVALDEEDVDNNGTEDGNHFADLGDTWAPPIVGRVRIQKTLTETETRHVAIFGGGLDPDHVSSPQRGSFLYIVDIETGKTLYKQKLEGAIPSAVAAGDFNRDSILDVLYVGTTAGYLYKVDLSHPEPLVNVQARDLNGNLHTVSRITANSWKPFKIFDTVDAGGVRRPIYFPPTLVNVSKINRLALAFGSGDRNDLWNLDSIENRFYFIVDELFAQGVTPKREIDYTVIDSEATSNAGQDFVEAPPLGRSRGWVLTLDPNERVIAQAFSLSGVTVFPTFKPAVVVTSGDDDDGETVCARTGTSRVFTVFSDNADPVLPPLENPNGTLKRSLVVNDALVTAPFVEQRTTKNPGESTIDQDTKRWQERIAEAMRRFYPDRARFGNLAWDVSFIKSDTGVVGPIPIPVGIVVNNWKEF
ncbi:MAG: hypothetical protein U0002_00945 [Thermoanaerobaculia bacterium]